MRALAFFPCRLFGDLLVLGGRPSRPQALALRPFAQWRVRLSRPTSLTD